MAWKLHVTHRELAREGHEAAYLTDRPVIPNPGGGDNIRGDGGGDTSSAPVQAQEA